MAVTSKSLPTIYNLACGTVKCYVYYDDSITGLVVPLTVRFLDIGEIVERVDAEGGTTDYENMEVTVAEDYTTYSEGFFYKLIIENPTFAVDFMFTIMNGTDEEFLFRGTVYRPGSNAPEMYLDNLSSAPSSWVRGMKMQLVTGLKTLQNVSMLYFSTGPVTDISQQTNSITRVSGSFITDGWYIGLKGSTADSGSNNGATFTATNVTGSIITISETFNVQSAAQVGSCTMTSFGDLCTEIVSHYTLLTRMTGLNSPVTDSFVTFRYVFASMIKLGYGESYDVTLVVDNSNDYSVNVGQYLFNGSGTTFVGDQPWISWLSAFILHTQFHPTDAWNATNTYFYSFPNAWELLKHICIEFGVVPRYSYGTATGLIDPTPANNKHRIILNSRGLSGSSITMTGKVLISTLIPETSKKIRRLSVSDPVSQKVAFYEGIEFTGDVPGSLTFDKSIGMDFIGGEPNLVWEALWYRSNILGGDKAWVIIRAGFWNYSTKQFDVLVEVDTYPVYRNKTFIKATEKYYFNRFTDNRVEYERTYGSIKANNGASDSQRWLQTLNIHTIHDGITSRTFYATEVAKNIITNQARIVWVEQ